jgi:hypothetical protein
MDERQEQQAQLRDQLVPQYPHTPDTTPSRKQSKAFLASGDVNNPTNIDDSSSPSTQHTTVFERLYALRLQQGHSAAQSMIDQHRNEVSGDFSMRSQRQNSQNPNFQSPLRKTITSVQAKALVER